MLLPLPLTGKHESTTKLLRHVLRPYAKFIKLIGLLKITEVLAKTNRLLNLRKEKNSDNSCTGINNDNADISQQRIP